MNTETRKQDIEQVGELFLTGASGEKLCCGSEIYQTEDGYSAFLAIDVDTGYSQMVKFKIEEL